MRPARSLARRWCFGILVPGLEALLALVQVGQGIAILPSTVRLEKIRQKVVPVRHDQKPIQMWMSAIWDPKRYLTPAAKMFIEEAHLYLRERIIPEENFSAFIRA
jgi:DNA-binding transcriptional LysR family regulator